MPLRATRVSIADEIIAMRRLRAGHKEKLVHVISAVFWMRTGSLRFASRMVASARRRAIVAERRAVLEIVFPKLGFFGAIDRASRRRSQHSILESKIVGPFVSELHVEDIRRQHVIRFIEHFTFYTEKSRSVRAPRGPRMLFLRRMLRAHCSCSDSRIPRSNRDRLSRKATCCSGG